MTAPTDKAGLLALADEPPCGRCDDSGYIEISNGGHWTGEGMSFRQEVCDCLCGRDVLRERALAQEKQS